ncbi:MAG: cation diffusion facilitator family transporter [Anaerolineae bacterium]
MAAHATHANAQNTRREVRRVLLITLVLNIIVSVSKIAIGLFSGSLAIVADGFHSLLDGINNIIALFANWFAARPPDENHPYGHRRFETLAALGIGVLLLIMGFELISSSIERLQSGEQPPDYTPLTFFIMLATLGINLFVAWYERREGNRLKSELLVADSAHTASDVLVTISVLVSMVLTQLGFGWADPLTALIVVILIVRTAFTILKQTGNVLADAAPIPPEALREVVEAVPVVEHVVRVRSRGPADAIYVDVDVEVPAATTTERSEAIADAIRQSIESRFDGVQEVEVHFAPDGDGADDPALLARSLADPLGLSVHEVRLTQHDGQQALEMHVEVPPGSTLEEAHEQVDTLETELRRALPEVGTITTHIEPAAPSIPLVEPDAADSATLEAKASKLLAERFPQAQWHDVHVTAAEGGLALTAHAGMAANLPVEQAHQTAEDAEVLLRSEFPSLTRVTLHTEPKEAEGGSAP